MNPQSEGSFGSGAAACDLLVPRRRTALISVSDKDQVAAFAGALHAMGWRLLSTGGTAALLRKANLPVTEVSEITGCEEMLDGRVKTLHPVIHAALLARRDDATHQQTLADQGIDGIDLVLVNLYPFEQTAAREEASLDEVIEQIDIGGPAMIRSAAKNWRDVIVVTAISQHQEVLSQLKGRGDLTPSARFALAVAAFNGISRYDAAISDFLSGVVLTPTGYERKAYSDQSNGRFVKVMDLRYGENAHQDAALYRDLYPAPGAIVTHEQLHGKDLSYNNIADADAAWECVKSFEVDACACVIVKHGNPCGVALAENPQAAYARALQTDPVSAFGGVIAFNCVVDLTVAKDLSQTFVEVLIAPDYEPAALRMLQRKPSLRILQIDLPPPVPSVIKARANALDIAIPPWFAGRNAHDVKRVGSGLLIQSADNKEVDKEALRIVSTRLPTAVELQDMLFAWMVAKYVKSNAIVFVKHRQTLGIGAGQMSRVDSVRIATLKAQNAGLSLQDSVVASDAFFPFRDGLDVLAQSGATAVIQPGGSVRDEEVIAAANEHQVAMAFTGVRHFRH